MTTPNDNQTTSESPSCDAACSPSGIDSDSIVDSCNCMTKSPNYMHHRHGCKYRLISERDEAREQRDNARKQAHLMRNTFSQSIGRHHVLPWENVKEHATLSARASVDHGVDVETTGEHENRAADRGCRVSPCSISYFWESLWISAFMAAISDSICWTA